MYVVQVNARDALVACVFVCVYICLYPFDVRMRDASRVFCVFEYETAGTHAHTHRRPRCPADKSKLKTEARRAAGETFGFRKCSSSAVGLAGWLAGGGARTHARCCTVLLLLARPRPSGVYGIFFYCACECVRERVRVCMCASDCPACAHIRVGPAGAHYSHSYTDCRRRVGSAASRRVEHRAYGIRNTIVRVRVRRRRRRPRRLWCVCVCV